MSYLATSEFCTGCTACASICPKGCITMVADEEGFLRPSIDAAKCVDCGRCQKVCPILQKSNSVTEKTTAYAAINQDTTVRQSSTSGGIFTLLCQWVLDHGGVVFGATYNDQFAVVHSMAETTEELSRQRGAKYSQSNLGDTFQQVTSCLKSDRYVLFSGTPCQIGGLLSFLGTKYEKLILVDLICHGVPSSKVWEHYIRYRSQQDAQGEFPIAINLRSKETGWPGYSIRFDYPNNQHYSSINSQDPYLRGFVGNLYLRPSCYHCHFKGSERHSDFTLGDYWGVWNQLPEYNDGKGTSLVLLHTEKAKYLWNILSPQMRYSAVDTVSALIENPSATTSSAFTEKRKDFFERYENEDFRTLVNELLPPKPAAAPPSFLKRLFRKVKRILVRVISPK